MCSDFESWLFANNAVQHEDGRISLSTRNRADEWGVTTFKFNESYTEFEGTWDYCGEGKKYAWSGKKKGS